MKADAKAIHKQVQARVSESGDVVVKGEVVDVETQEYIMIRDEHGNIFRWVARFVEEICGRDS